MRALYALLPALCSFGLSAADPAPLLEIALPDLQRSVTRFDAGIYGTIWNDPSLDGLRRYLNSELAPLEADLGFNPTTAILSSAGLEARVSAPVNSSDPWTVVQLRGADPALAAALRREMPDGTLGQAANEPSVALDGTTLILANGGATLAPIPASSSSNDLELRWFADAIIALARANTGPRDQTALALLTDFLSSGSLQAELIDTGVSQRLNLDTMPAGLAPVDRQLLARLPAETLMAFAAGIDGAAWWQAHQGVIMASVAHEMLGDATQTEAAEQQIAGLLAGFGIQNGLTGLFADMQGTTVSLVTAGGGLYPGVSIAIPRSAGIDALINLSMGMGGMIAPQDGQLRFIVLRGFGNRGETIAPGAVVGRDATHWWVSTDPVFLADYLEGKTSGWDTSTAGALALERAQADTVMLGATNAPALMRTVVPLIALGSGFIDEGRHVEGLAQAALRLARAAEPDTFIGGPKGAGFQLEVRGAIGGLSYLSTGQVALIAAIAIPNLMESRVKSSEMAASASLRSGIFSGQEIYRSSAHNDIDSDNKGEYAFLPQLAGLEDNFGRGPNDQDRTRAGNLEIISSQFSGPEQDVNGYHYQVWLPDGEGGAMDYATAKARFEAGDLWQANPSESYFIAYAWPVDPGETGHRVFAITQTGTVRAQRADLVELPPVWNAMANGEGSEFKVVTRSTAWDPQ
ncbi:MAG: hypothetical protein PF961_01125 [Planctomycetota bacterium]|jgi:hypothetical protein|nr:hypothetical protein [Planctomycetota bacterium]